MPEIDSEKIDRIYRMLYALAKYLVANVAR